MRRRTMLLALVSMVGGGATAMAASDRTGVGQAVVAVHQLLPVLRHCLNRLSLISLINRSVRLCWNRVIITLIIIMKEGMD